ncbi:Methyltransferase FkbM [Candidatus Nanopelagicaceae bacterium]
MLISIREQSLVWGVRPKGIVHVGGHLGEENSEYKSNSWGQVIWIEAQPALAARLKEVTSQLGDRVIQAAIWDSSGEELTLHVSSNSESTSLLEFGTHSKVHPEIHFSAEIPVKTVTLDDLNLPENHDYLALDIQGVELRALKGFKKGLQNINWICTEINKKEVYKDCALIDEMDRFLDEYGFTRKVTRLTPFGWGDVLYIRRSHIPHLGVQATFKLPGFYISYVWLQVKSYLRAIQRKFLFQRTEQKASPLQDK